MFTNKVLQKLENLEMWQCSKNQSEWSLRRVSWESGVHFSAANVGRRIWSAVGILMMLQQLQTIGEDRIAIVGTHSLTVKDLLQFGLRCCCLDTEPTLIIINIYIKLILQFRFYFLDKKVYRLSQNLNFFITSWQCTLLNL